MKIDGIISMREYHKQVFADIVYEWEEDLSRYLNAPIVHWGRKHDLASAALHRLPWLPVLKNIALSPRKRYLRFVMNALDDTPLFNHRSCIPVIIDFFVDRDNMQKFISIYDRCEYVFITSRQAYDVLCEYELPFKIVHFPLTLSDRYLPEEDMLFEKKYNLTLFGAQIFDKTLKGYIDRYCEEHPDFVYVAKADGSNEYHTSRGDKVADATDRNAYFDLLKSTRVVVYSTPGIRGRATAHGYDQVTPKFFEFMAAQCQVIPRYTDNSDTRYFGLTEYAPSVESYDEFASMLDRYLTNPVDVDFCRSYLSRHLTSSLTPIIDAI